jgi:hypothetical protein
MPLQVRKSVAVVALLVLAAVTVFGVLGAVTWSATAILSRSNEPITLSEATSPDGTWSIQVVAKPQMMGGYDIVLFEGDGQGKMLPGSAVIDLTRDLDAARNRHLVRFVDDNTAQVGSRTLERPSSLRK